MAMIEVLLEGSSVITLMPEHELVKKVGGLDNEVERTRWVEYRLRTDPDNPRPVHRSAHVHLKTGLFAQPQQAHF